MAEISNVIMTLFDKRGAASFASELDKMGVKIFSTGGTFNELAKSGINAVRVEDYTGFPEMMDGRVKSLHPKIHGGILACRDNKNHLKSAEEHGITMFDMAIVNFYPFKERVKSGRALSEIIENIDIGGPALVRSAAKNFRDVAVVVSPDDYGKIIDEMKRNGRELSLETRFELARKAFAYTAFYDGYIASFFSTLDCNGQKRSECPEILTLQFTKKKDLRYGENPHQKAAIYVDADAENGGVGLAEQIHGKELSFNNYMDLESAKNIVSVFDKPAVAIVKHTNPCGAAIGSNLAEAYEKALESDPVSAFGSIVAVNRILDGECALLMSKLFIEAIIAPKFSQEAKDVLSKKKNVRLLEIGNFAKNYGADFELKKISGALLAESGERRIITEKDFSFVTEKRPNVQQIQDLVFAQNLVRFIRSNAVLLAGNGATIGVGAGQMSRIDSLEIAIKKARSPLGGHVMASDAFFPFRDCVDRAASVGIAAIVQPGGSKRDQESIDACNERGIAMVFTGIRSFRHL